MFLIAESGLSVIVPFLGLGIIPFGPSVLATWASMGMASGVAITTSKSLPGTILPSRISLMVVSLAKMMLVPAVACPKTRMRLVATLRGLGKVRLNFCSFLFKVKWASIVPSNLVLAVFLANSIASVVEYCLFLSINSLALM